MHTCWSYRLLKWNCNVLILLVRSIIFACVYVYWFWSSKFIWHFFFFYLMLCFDFYCLGGQQQINNELLRTHCAHLRSSWKQMEKQRSNIVCVSVFVTWMLTSTTGHGMLQSQWFSKKKKKIIVFFLCLTYQTDVAVCASVTPLKIGAKHRRSRRPCWRAGPMTTWLTLTITWTIWGTTGPTLWSTSPSLICANSQKHTAVGGGGAHTDAHSNAAAISACLMLLAAQHRSVQHAALVPSRDLCADGNQRCTDRLHYWVKSKRCSCTVGMCPL